MTVDGTLAASLASERGRGGRLHVDPNLCLPKNLDIFVIGDAPAGVPLGPHDQSLAPAAGAGCGVQSGRHAATQILDNISGKVAPRPFAYKDKGVMATIGRRAAVAEINEGPLHDFAVKGTLGWLAWLGLHLVYLVGVRNRAVVLLNWLWRYVGWVAGPRLIIDDESTGTAQ